MNRKQQFSVYREAMRGIAHVNGAVAWRNASHNGLTVAIVPCLEGSADPKFYRVAVARCSESDEFDYRRGAIIAYNRLWYGKFITMPNPFPDSPPQRAAEYFAALLDLEFL